MQQKTFRQRSLVRHRAARGRSRTFISFISPDSLPEAHAGQPVKRIRRWTNASGPAVGAVACAGGGVGFRRVAEKGRTAAVSARPVPAFRQGVLQENGGIRGRACPHLSEKKGGGDTPPLGLTRGPPGLARDPVVSGGKNSDTPPEI